MPQFDEKHVKLCGGIVVWDGVTQPETVQQGSKAGSPKWTLKVVFPPNSPDVALYDQLSRQALQESKFRGTLPAGGRMPIGVATAQEFGGMFPGWPVISFKTTLRFPDVYDENGALIDQFALKQVLYSGQRVDVLAGCYAYDNAGNKGVGASLDAFGIILSAQAQRLAIGGTGMNTAGAFGGGGQQPAPQPQYGQQPAPQPQYGQQPAPQPQYGQQPAPQGPEQAHNFLPQQQ